MGEVSVPTALMKQIEAVASDLSEGTVSTALMKQIEAVPGRLSGGKCQSPQH